MIDKKVIDGHVIPGHVIFTAPAHLEHPYETTAFEDNLKVTATFFTQDDGKQKKSKEKCFIYSNDANLMSFTYRYEFNSQPTSNRTRSLVIQSIRQALCWLKSCWEIFRLKME